MRTRIRVLVVDDSALIRQMLTQALSLDPRVEVVGTAGNGVDAIEKVRALQPDVVTLDIEMPELNGLESLPFIMRESAARVVMLSSVDDPDTTYAALSCGAVDFVPKPKGGFASSLSDLADVMLKKIKTAYRVEPGKRLQASGPPLNRDGSVMASKRYTTARRADSVDRLVVMASSTGGPPALEKVFSGLPGNLPVAYLVVQHLPAGFTASLAKRLSRIAGFDVQEAADGMRVEAGRGYLAPHGAHMQVSGHPGRPTLLSMDAAPAIHGVRPSADPLFKSAATGYGPNITGVVLSGMGQDGAAGLLSIFGAGGSTIVQDEASSVVWGMPGAAVRLGAAQKIVPVGRIAAEIRRTMRDGS